MKNPSSDIKTLAYVLRRTNYGEADRILNLLTPSGKISAIAKGVRKEKSKLAGGVEIFTLSELNIHQGRSEIGVVTSAKMVRYYGNIVKDLSRMEMGATILKKISIASEGASAAEYFQILDESLMGLNEGYNLGLIEAWFYFNLLKTAGEEINLYRDENGEKLNAHLRYNWNIAEKAFTPYVDGEFGEDAIKLMRLMTSAKLALVERVKDTGQIIPQILSLVRSMTR